MKKLAIIFLMLLSVASCERQKPVTIRLIGDSTMADKSEPEINPEHGWGQVLHEFFDDHVTVVNYARNGRSTKSFIDEGLWNEVLSDLQAGDYVFIQFGHNDQKDHDPKRYTNPYTVYRANLIRYVQDTRNKGGIPVLLSSIVRRNFNEYGTLIDTHGVYPFIVRDVARDLNVDFVDMQLKSEELVTSLGKEASKELYLWYGPGVYYKYPEGKEDNTHFTRKGALEMARLAVEGLAEIHSGLNSYRITPDSTAVR